MKMTRATRLIAGLVGVFVFLLILAVIVVKVVFTKDRILSLLTPQIERAIDRQVTIADASITLWGGIGVRLEGIAVQNPVGFPQEPMLGADVLDVKAQFWPLLSGRAVVDRIVITGAYASVDVNPEGRSNFADIFKDRVPADTVSADAQQRFTVGILEFRDARLSWRDRRSGRWIDLFGADADVAVDAIHAHVPAFVGDLRFDSLLMYQENRRLAIRAGEPSLHVRGSWDKSSRTFVVDSSMAEWWGAKLSLTGQARMLPSLYEIAVNARLASVQVAELIREVDSVFPLPKLAELRGMMSGSLEARTVWPLPENTVPDWQGRFELVDVKWPLPQTGAVVTVPRVEIRGSDRSLSWSAPGGQVTGGTFSTSGTIDQLFVGDETFSARVQADMPLEGVRGLIPESWRSSISGALDLDLTGFGSVKDWEKIHLNGRVRSDRLTLLDEDWEFDSVTVAIDGRLSGHGIHVSRCDWHAGDSRGALTGRIEGFIPAALSGFTLPDIPHGEITVSAPYLNLDRLIGSETADSTLDAATFTAADIPLLSLTGTLQADTVIYNDVQFVNVQSPVSFKDRIMTLQQVTAMAYGGGVSGRLVWNLNPWPSPEFFTSLSAEGVEANDFFSRYLGWAGGVSGRISMSGEFSGSGRSAQQIIPTLLAQGRIDLTASRLESAPLLQQIGQVVGLPGLDRPRTLRDLRLPFRIDDGRIITDEFKVIWDDVSYSISGSFGLDQSLHYSVTARALSDRAPHAVQGIGTRFSVRGNVSSPEITIDAAGTAREALGNAVDRAKDTLKQSIEQTLDNLLQPRKP